MNFIVLSDTHVSAKPDAQPFLWWHKNLVPDSADICRLAVEDINRLKPDFVVHCGDVTDPGDGPSMELARDVFGGLDCPFYFVPGNHDCWEKGARARANRLFGLSGGDLLYRTIELAEATLLLIDGAYWQSYEAEYKDYLDHEDLVKAMQQSEYAGPGGGLCIPEKERDWIEGALRQNRDKTVLAFLHAGLRGRGLYQTSKDQQGRLLAEPPMKIDYGYRDSEELLGLLRAAGNVAAVFSGHTHWNECYSEDGMLHCQTGALIQYPCKMRRIWLSEKSLSGGMIPLSDPTFAERSFVEDSDGAFVAGRPEDREFELTW